MEQRYPRGRRHKASLTSKYLAIVNNAAASRPHNSNPRSLRITMAAECTLCRRLRWERVDRSSESIVTEMRLWVRPSRHDQPATQTLKPTSDCGVRCEENKWGNMMKISKGWVLIERGSVWKRDSETRIRRWRSSSSKHWGDCYSKAGYSKYKSLGPNNNRSHIWPVFPFLEHTCGASVTNNLLPTTLSTYYLLNWLFLQQAKGAKSYSP